MNRLCALLKIDAPIIQAGMIWCSGWELASASANSGILGVIGSGSMYPDILRDQIRKCKGATDRSFAVNIPLIYPQIDDHLDIIIDEGVKVVISSAGNPKAHTARLQEAGIKVLHVVSSRKFALKAEAAGVDGVIAEGFEAGGHNGREETTTMCLIPDVASAINVPLVAAGGIGSGRAMLAAMTLGADGVQVGSRFVATPEASAHIAFKQRVISADEGDTELTLKELTPVRLLKNPFHAAVKKAYDACSTDDELRALLGRGRAKKGMYEGDMDEGELEIGQVSSQISSIMPVSEVVAEFISDYKEQLALQEKAVRFQF